MSLPLPWVDRIFDKLTLTYGQAFLARWRDLDLNAVKSDWCYELSAMERAPNAIAFALANLPDRPPSVMDFKTLCRQAPSAEVPMLDMPKADPERMRAELAKLGNWRSPPQQVSSKDWAHKLLSSDKRHSPTVLAMARAALGQQTAEA
jgi:hypothetical protein